MFIIEKKKNKNVRLIFLFYILFDYFSCIYTITYFFNVQKYNGNLLGGYQSDVNLCMSLIYLP